jgi:hypothetical protein
MSNIRLTPEQAEAAQKRALEGWRRQGMVRTHVCEGPGDADKEVLGFGHSQAGKSPQKSGKSRQRSNLEVLLQEQIEKAALPAPEYDVCYLIGSKHRLDVCWADRKFGCEIQGEVHRIKSKFHSDVVKRVLGQLQGWLIVEVDREAIKSGKALEWIKQLLPRLP